MVRSALHVRTRPSLSGERLASPVAELSDRFGDRRQTSRDGAMALSRPPNVNSRFATARPDVVRAPPPRETGRPCRDMSVFRVAPPPVNR